VGVALEGHTFAGIKRSGGFNQTDHADLYKLFHFHERRDACLQVHRNALDHA
jgi:hypothetical protein